MLFAQSVNLAHCHAYCNATLKDQQGPSTTSLPPSPLKLIPGNTCLRKPSTSPNSTSYAFTQQQMLLSHTQLKHTSNLFTSTCRSLQQPAAGTSPQSQMHQQPLQGISALQQHLQSALYAAASAPYACFGKEHITLEHH